MSRPTTSDLAAVFDGVVGEKALSQGEYDQCKLHLNISSGPARNSSSLAILQQLQVSRLT